MTGVSACPRHAATKTSSKYLNTYVEHPEQSEVKVHELTFMATLPFYSNPFTAIEGIHLVGHIAKSNIARVNRLVAADSLLVSVQFL